MKLIRKLFDLIIIKNATLFSSYLVVFFGIALILSLGLFLTTDFLNQQKVIPAVKSKFNRHMMRLELAGNANDVFDLLGTFETCCQESYNCCCVSTLDHLGILKPGINKQGVINRNVISLQNLPDMYIPLFYSMFCASIFLFLSYLNEDLRLARKILGVGLLLCLLMLVSEIIENTILVKLTGYITEDAVPQSLINYLWASARIKFTAIFLSSLLFALLYSRYLWKHKSYFLAAAFAALYVANAVIGLIAVYSEERMYLMNFGFPLIILSWLGSFVYSARFICKS